LMRNQKCRPMQPCSRVELEVDHQDVGVAAPKVEDFGGEAGPEQVQDQERRYGETGGELRRFPGGHGQPPAQVERPEGESEVDQNRAVKQQRAEGIAPEREEPEATGFERLERDQPQGMVQIMGQQIGKEDETGPKTQPADHGGFPSARFAQRS
jgi:hypothetical protein